MNNGVHREAPPRVLVIDDEEIARQTIGAVLENQGYDLHFARSGPEGLEMARALNPRAISCDMMMPGMTGLEVCSRLKRDAATRHMPIIAITALDSKDILSEALAAGADDFVGKPIHPCELRARIRSMIRISGQYGELEAALRLRTDLSEMVVHDLRGPLTGMLLSTDLIRLDPLTEQQSAALVSLEAAGERLRRLIHDLLMMGRIEAGRLPLERAATAPGPLLDRAVENRRPLAESKGIVLQRKPGNADTLSVSMDAGLIERLVDNLLANAVKFSPRGGRVTIAALLVSGTAAIEVADEGPGVPPEMRERIFEKYEVGQVRPDVPQIGLGLAFCKLVAEAHGGGISCRARPPQGTVFSVRWPA